MSTPIRFDLDDANFNFSALEKLDLRTLQSVESYEYARESTVIRTSLELWLRKNANLHDYWEDNHEKDFLIWETVKKSGLVETGKYYKVIRQPEGAALLQYLTMRRDETFEVGTKRRCRPAEERMFLRARLRDKLNVGGKGGIYLTDLARELVEDLPWTRIAQHRRDNALQQARRESWSVRADRLRTKISDFGVQVAWRDEMRARGCMTRWTRPPIPTDGREVVAMRISWRGYDDEQLVERFREMIPKLRPKGVNAVPGNELDLARSQMKTLNDLAVLRALSKMRMENVPGYFQVLPVS
jgi:hypothetical protein